MKHIRWYLLSVFTILIALAGACAPPTTPTLIMTEVPTFIGETPSVEETSIPIPPTLDPIDQLLTDLQETPVRIVVPTPDNDEELDWRPPPYDVPLAIRPEDHFYFHRPIPSGYVNWPHPRYRYGNTHFGENPVHTGVDLGADRGDPVHAAGPGEVVWEGFGLYRGIEDPEDPYGLSIAIKHDFGHKGQQLYTIYAHLQAEYVWLGQRVNGEEVIGAVGQTGHTSGPHLHFEVRLGTNDFFSTRNPELWMVPPQGWAVLAGRVTNTYGFVLSEHLVQIRSLETDTLWNVWTYNPDGVHSDTDYGENFVISDLPAGPYEIRIDYRGRKYITQLLLDPGRTNFLKFRGWNGFVHERELAEVNLDQVPVP
ncbi:MAG: peptidoglycan DD-metalloendopeptidase family protein [Anaerolineales bacterium]|nr:peptidoglycan DD-metalloendopeptidase family protein [Anaerolineales bacterium]